METEKKDNFLSVSILISAVMVVAASAYALGRENVSGEAGFLLLPQEDGLEQKVLPPDGIPLPVRWGDLGAQMVQAGVIDVEKFEDLYGGELNKEMKQLLYGADNGNIKINMQNSGTLLNLFWAFGLGNKSDVLENGPMTAYGDAGMFASTGGWTLAVGDAMEHYSRHRFVSLTREQQELVERVSKNIYRPCCGNSTYFPDCNHGMAMLGLLELMAAQGVTEDEIYRAALAVNSYWFPDTYLAIAKLFEKRGITWKDVNPREVLGADYSSAQGSQKVLREIEPEPFRGGGSCGVQ